MVNGRIIIGLLGVLSACLGLTGIVVTNLIRNRQWDKTQKILKENNVRIIKMINSSFYWNPTEGFSSNKESIYKYDPTAIKINFWCIVIGLFSLFIFFLATLTSLWGFGIIQ